METKQLFEEGASVRNVSYSTYFKRFATKPALTIRDRLNKVLELVNQLSDEHLQLKEAIIVEGAVLLQSAERIISLRKDKWKFFECNENLLYMCYAENLSANHREEYQTATEVLGTSFLLLCHAEYREWERDHYTEFMRLRHRVKMARAAKAGTTEVKPLDDRNRWLYERRRAGAKWGDLQNELLIRTETDKPDWRPLADIPCVIRVVRDFQDDNRHLPRIKKGKGGRPPGPSKHLRDK